MTDIAVDSTDQTPRYRDAFESLLEEIRAVPKKKYVVITLPIEDAVITVVRKMTKLREFRAQLVRCLPEFPMDQFDKLEAYALALGHAQTLYKTATDPPAAVLALAENATIRRDLLFDEISLLAKRGLLDASPLKAVKCLNGYANLSFDLSYLVNILRNNWSSVCGRTGTTLEELDQIEILMAQLPIAAGRRDKEPEITAQAVRDRQAAYALFIGAYEEVRAAVVYLRRKQRDADSIAPSLYLGRAAPKKKPADETNATQPVATSAANPPPTAAFGANTAQSAAMNPDSAAMGPFM